MENSERLNFEYWDNSKWPVVIVDLVNYDADRYLVNYDADRYFEILDWIRDNIDMPYRHSRWRWYEFYVEVKFRYEKDYIMFKLRWS